jgi:hypothetical protein
MTRYHLQSASNILSVLLLDANPHEELQAMLKQLEVGMRRRCVLMKQHFGRIMTGIRISSSGA